MNAQVKLDLSSMTQTELVQFGVTVGVQLIDNEATFPFAPIAGADLQDLALATQQAAADAAVARATWREKVAEQHDMSTMLMNALRRTGAYVQNVSAGNAATILLSGMSVRNPSQPIGELHAPQALALVLSTNPGEMGLKWLPVKGASLYVTQYAPGATLPTHWLADVTSTKAKCHLTGLTSGARYWFRVAATGAAGQSLYTDALSAIVQ